MSVEISVREEAKKAGALPFRWEAFSLGETGVNAEGKRKAEDTPENFPKLQPEAHIFLERVGEIALVLEEKLAEKWSRHGRLQEKTLKERLRWSNSPVGESPWKSPWPYVPRSIETLNCVLVSLVARPGELEVGRGQARDVNGGSGRITDSQDVFYKTRTAVRRRGRFSDTLTLELKPVSLLSRVARGTLASFPEAEVVLRPRGSSRMNGGNGGQLENFDGLSRDEIREALAYNGSAERIARIMGEFWVTRPGVEVTCGAVRLKIEFGRVVECRLGIEESKYTPEFEWVPVEEVNKLIEAGRGKEDSSSDSGTIADSAGILTWEAALELSLEDVCGYAPKDGAERWLSRIVEDIGLKAAKLWR